MKSVIFGANRPTGRLAIARPLAAGHSVVAVTRQPRKFPIQERELTVVGADVFDAAAVGDAVAEADATQWCRCWGAVHPGKGLNLFGRNRKHRGRRARSRNDYVIVSTTEGTPTVLQMIRREACSANASKPGSVRRASPRLVRRCAQRSPSNGLIPQPD
jgi:hypothetical protein